MDNEFEGREFLVCVAGMMTFQNDVFQSKKSILKYHTTNYIKSSCTRYYKVYYYKWRAYSTLKEYGFIHKTANNSENYIDPITGVETQTIETLRRHVKNNQNNIKMYIDKLESRLQEE